MRNVSITHGARDASNKSEKRGALSLLPFFQPASPGDEKNFVTSKHITFLRHKNADSLLIKE